MPFIDLDFGLLDSGKNDHMTTIQTPNFSQSSAPLSNPITSMLRDSRHRINVEATTNFSSKCQ